MIYDATIVIPLLRQRDDWLEQSVRSALAQSVPTEVIVVNSKMTTASNLQILDQLQRQHNNVTVLCEEKPSSFPNAINTGIRKAGAERIGLLLSDDWLDRSAVAECLPIPADIVATGHAVYFPDGRVNEAACMDASVTRFEALPTLEAKASYLEHFFLFRKEMLLGVGGLDETIGNYPGIDDFDLIWTMLERDATVGIVEKRLYHYRDHDEQRLTLADPEEAVRNLRKILRKHGVADEDASDIIKRHARWYGMPLYKVMNPVDRGS